MPNVNAIHSVGLSLVARLRDAYPSGWRASLPCEFYLVGSGQLEDPGGGTNTLVVWLYQITWNAQIRPVRTERGAGPLVVDLHFMITAFTDSAQAEQRILAWAMREMHRQPMLDLSTLSEEGGWTAADQVQVVPEQLSTEDLFRVWEAIEPRYRLCATYVVRGVALDDEPGDEAVPVVATRFELRARGGA